MTGASRRATTFDRLAIAFVGVCVINLYVLALTGDPPTVPSPHPKGAPGSGQPPADPDGGKRVAVISVSSAAKLADVFAESGYRLDVVRVHGGVPRLFIANLPRDLSKIRRPAQRKMVFIMTALPLILYVNELILRDRRRIEILHVLSEAGVDPGPDDQAWLRSMRRRYGLPEAGLQELLRRVDVIPPSLALAQGAEESGWGTSRFAREGNALFGQRTYGDGDGLVPKRRDKGETHKVRTFDMLVDAVKAYAHNLNTHLAYAGFRALRAGMRGRGAAISGFTLAGALTKYSERGEDYVSSLRAIIRANGLEPFDRARLDDGVAEAAGPDA